MEIVVAYSVLRPGIQIVNINALCSNVTPSIKARKDASGKETNSLSEKYTKLEKTRNKLLNELNELQLNIIKINKMIDLFETSKNLSLEFDERLWIATVDKVLVYHDCLVFKFFDGLEVREEW